MDRTVLNGVALKRCRTTKHNLRTTDQHNSASLSTRAIRYDRILDDEIPRACLNVNSRLVGLPLPDCEISCNCRIDRQRFAVDDIQRIADVLIAIDVAILLPQCILDALRNGSQRIDKIVSLRIGLHIQLLP